MGAIGQISGVSSAAANAAVARLGVVSQAGVQAQIAAVKPVVPHKTPPAGLLAFDPASPEVDLTGQPVEQIRALHQYRTSVQLLQQGSGGGSGSQASVQA